MSEFRTVFVTIHPDLLRWVLAGENRWTSGVAEDGTTVKITAAKDASADQRAGDIDSHEKGDT